MIQLWTAFASSTMLWEPLTRVESTLGFRAFLPPDGSHFLLEQKEAEMRNRISLAKKGSSMATGNCWSYPKSANPRRIRPSPIESTYPSPLKGYSFVILLEPLIWTTVLLVQYYSPRMSSLSAAQESGTMRVRRYKASVACNTCRRRKLKCDGLRPSAEPNSRLVYVRP